MLVLPHIFAGPFLYNKGRVTTETLVALVPLDTCKGAVAQAWT